MELLVSAGRTANAPHSLLPPCVLHEDEHLLVVNKPPGWNTHAPSPYAGEGIYDWLRHREPRWAALAIIHRLDKETSGVMVFGKTPVANKSLTEQFTERKVHKRYVLLTDRPVLKSEWRVVSKLHRERSVYASRQDSSGEQAETVFKVIRREEGHTVVQAEPLTGRTHQIRVHAKESGLPILGDTVYGGSPFARVCLHAEAISFQHPANGERVTFEAPPDFASVPSVALRVAFIAPEETDCFRIIHGASDGEPGWYVDKLGGWLLSQSETVPDEHRREKLIGFMVRYGALGAYHKQLNRQVRRTAVAEAAPQHVLAEAAPERFTVRENGVMFDLSFAEGYSVGLFLDQRDNRRRLLTGHVAGGFAFALGSSADIPVRGFPRLSSLEDRATGKSPEPSGWKACATELPGAEVLNVFSYTCGFSACAALAGARTTSLDLSKKYLAWGRRNFELNGLDPAAHDFIFGDAFDWLRRLAKKQRQFDLVVLDPPTFSQSKESGVFRAEKDFGRLATATLPLLKPDGVLLASTNAASLPPEEFVASVSGAIEKAGRQVVQEFYVPQPPDFPVSRAEPAYLKTCWWRVK